MAPITLHLKTLKENVKIKSIYLSQFFSVFLLHLTIAVFLLHLTIALNIKCNQSHLTKW